ncbi:MAG TPA: NAD(P)-binding protein [Herpetosiphonaceae bacterium]
MKDIPIAILGAGSAGVCAASTIAQRDPQLMQLFEQSAVVGGVSRSYAVGELVFDYGLHGFYTKDAEIFELFAAAVEHEYHRLVPRTADYYQGTWTRHPIYLNLFPLPKEVLAPCLIDMAEAAQHPPAAPSENYGEWCRQHYGASYSDIFEFPFVRKFWTVAAEELALWGPPRKFRAPNMREVISGALYAEPPNAWHVNEYFYPKQGGFGQYIGGLAQALHVHTQKQAIGVDPRRKVVAFADGTSVHYRYLISSLPLPALIAITADVPQSIREAAQRLRHTSAVLVSLGIDRSNVLDYHWIWAYDPAIRFSRLSSPSQYSPASAPHGTSSLQAEIYVRGSLPDMASVYETTLHDLTAMGILKPDDRIIASDIRSIGYAYVIYDRQTRADVAAIHGFLRERNIICCGRYGNWDNSNVDEVMVDTRQKIQALLGDIT